MLSILLLGPPQILRDGAPIELPRRRSRALVYYLAAQAGPVSRETLLPLLWPDHERTAAQQILRTTLHGVRKAIGAALIASDDQLAIDRATDIDLRALAAAPQADETALTTALARYRGEFLAGFSLPDCEGFEEWLAAEREHARLLAVRSLARLGRLYEARGEYAAALESLARALAFDPLQEDLQRTAIRLHYLSGDRVGAIRRYEQLRELLDAEMGVPPMEETRALYDAVVTDTLPREGPSGWAGERVTLVPSAYPLSPSPGDLLPFIGRIAELDLLETATRAGRLVLIEGEAGIGKTRLAEEFLARHVGLSLIGPARELEQSLPYQPIVAALRALIACAEWPALRKKLGLDPLWLREAARLLPELADLPGAGQFVASALPPAEEARLWEALTRLLIGLARLVPLALLIDDLQWADISTLGLLGYLLRRGEAAPLSLITTTRPALPRSPLSGLLTALTREGRLERINLSRLAPDETVSLARSLSPQYAQPLASWIERNAEGNPYIIGELVGYARASGLLLPDGVLNLSALATPPVVPQTVYSLIQGRLGQLSDGARRVLDAAVAAGREFEFEVAARAAALSEGAALDALDELRAARVVQTLDNGRFRFDHSLTMEVAYREVGEPRHRLLHRRIGEALELLHRDRLDAEAGLIASHFAEGGAPERAAVYAIRAGRRAAGVAAWAEAAAFYEQALAGVDARQRPATLRALGEALFHAGEAARSAERLREALDLANTPAEANAARISLARALVPQGRYAEVIDLVRPLDGSNNPDEAVTALFLWGTALSLEGADLVAAAERLRAAEQIIVAKNAGGPQALAQVRFELGSVMAQQGDLVRAIALYQEAIVVADGAAETDEIDSALTWRILARNNLAYHLHLLGDLDAAARHIGDAINLAEQRGAIGLQPYLLSTSGEIALARGELNMADEQFSAGLGLAERLHVPERVAGLHANLGLVAISRGQAALAIHHLSGAMARADALGTQHLAAQIRIWLAPLLPPAEARAAIDEARAIAESGGRKRLLEAIAQLERGV